MQTVVSIITHVRKGDSFLLRKKPDGSLPYKETWYGFGAILDGEHTNAEQEIQKSLTARAGITIRVSEYLWWDTEVKKDLDGETKFFVYLDTISEYESGELTLSEGIEKLEWIPIGKLNDYDIVPPSRKFFKRYLKENK